ncbi:hypothetical protein HGRIS_013837 [Hohenbuehelia grisea]|uniref:Uncharacterized protein n=1 Tax=Hohenbuehelia grisea TaxID=104357 RepID=A0ABR3IWT9_9AGAR
MGRFPTSTLTRDVASSSRLGTIAPWCDRRAVYVPMVTLLVSSQSIIKSSGTSEELIAYPWAMSVRFPADNHHRYLRVITQTEHAHVVSLICSREIIHLRAPWRFRAHLEGVRSVRSVMYSLTRVVPGPYAQPINLILATVRRSCPIAGGGFQQVVPSHA